MYEQYNMLIHLLLSVQVISAHKAPTALKAAPPQVSVKLASSSTVPGMMQSWTVSSVCQDSTALGVAMLSPMDSVVLATTVRVVKTRPHPLATTAAWDTTALKEVLLSSDVLLEHTKMNLAKSSVSPAQWGSTATV